MGGARPTGRWPQFRTIQEKEVTILNNKECDSFYHKFSKISSLIRIINSQMICASDTHREEFCYVSTCRLVHSPPRHLARSGARGTGEEGEEGDSGEGATLQFLSSFQIFAGPDTAA